MTNLSNIVVGKSILHEGQEDSNEADKEPDVDGSNVGNGWHVLSNVQDLGDDRQDGHDAERYSSRDPIDIDPKGDPRQGDNQCTRNVNRKQG